MGKLVFNMNKTLKLSNALSCDIEMDEESDIGTITDKMQGYIKIKGARQMGPLVQYMRPYINDNGELDIHIRLITQCNNFLHDVDKPYHMESVMRVQNCMYCRYIGPEEKLKFAHDKINIEAFESDIELTGESYTVFVDSNEEDETITADVFMPKA